MSQMWNLYKKKNGKTRETKTKRKGCNGEKAAKLKEFVVTSRNIKSIEIGTTVCCTSRGKVNTNGNKWISLTHWRHT